MAHALMRIVLAGYLAGLVGCLAYLATRRSGLARAGMILVMLTFALHVVAYGLLCASSRAMVISSPAGAFSLLALLTVLVLLVVSARHRLNILGAFVLPLVVAAMIPAVASPLPVEYPERLRGILFPAHVVSTFAGLAGFTAVFGIAVAYLIQERQLKARRPHELAFLLPSLGDLDRIATRLVMLSLAALVVGIVTGVLFAVQRTGALWPGDPKSYATLVSAAVYGAVLGLRGWGGLRGRSFALLLIVGFALVMITFAGLSHAPAEST